MRSDETTTDTATCDRPQVERDEVTAQRVGEVMVARPKTLPADATVGDARRFFANPKVITALLVDGTAFAGLLEREHLPAAAAEDAPVREYAQRDVPTIAPDRPMRDAVAMLDADDSRRLVVLDDDGVTLAGLLCLDTQRAGFCQG